MYLCAHLCKFVFVIECRRWERIRVRAIFSSDTVAAAGEKENFVARAVFQDDVHLTSTLSVAKNELGTSASDAGHVGDAMFILFAVLSQRMGVRYWF